jgi:hypothetical protein
MKKDTAEHYLDLEIAQREEALELTRRLRERLGGGGNGVCVPLPTQESELVVPRTVCLAAGVLRRRAR